jgi:hypothetical protein
VQIRAVCVARSTSGMADWRPIVIESPVVSGATAGRDHGSRYRRRSCCGGLRLAGLIPGDGLLHRGVVRGGLEAAEGGLELAGVNDERRADW